MDILPQNNQGRINKPFRTHFLVPIGPRRLLFFDTINQD